MTALNKDIKFPLKHYDRLCFLKSFVKNPNIIVGDYTYYDDFENIKSMEKYLKYILIILFSIVTQAIFGQSANDTTSVFNLYEKPNYKEANKFCYKNGIVFYQSATFNDLSIIDDEYSQILSINILDSAILAGKKIFDLEKDSAEIKCTFHKISLWNWSDRNLKFVGDIKIISIAKKRIEIEFDLIVTELGKNVYVYHGKRLFKKSKPLIKEKISHKLL